MVASCIESVITPPTFFVKAIKSWGVLFKIMVHMYQKHSKKQIYMKILIQCLKINGLEKSSEVESPKIEFY